MYRFLFASYAASLSVRDSVKCRRLIDSKWYKEHFGEVFKLTGDQNQKQRFENDQTGYRIATSVDGALTGEGGDIIIIDDPNIAGFDLCANPIQGGWPGHLLTYHIDLDPHPIW